MAWNDRLPAASSASAAAQDMLERVRSLLAGAYAVETEVGRGGMGAVFRARDLRHQRTVAVKVLPAQLATAVGASRFLREVRTAAALVHPNIVAVFDSGEADGLLYYIMPFVTGETLRERLARERSLPVRDALRIASEVAEALAFAHEQGVVHRDVKPENILLGAQGHAQVTDFGVARALSEAADTRLTGTGVFVGSPLYMSLEQAMGAAVDGRADVYSLGCVLYEMLSGSPPYEGPTPSAILARQLTADAAPLRHRREEVPGDLEALVARTLARSPGERPDAQALARQLLGLAAVPSLEPANDRAATPVPRTGLASIGATPAARGGRLRRAVPWALAATAVAAAGTGLSSILRHPARPHAAVSVLVLPAPGAAGAATGLDDLLANSLDLVPQVKALRWRADAGASDWRTQSALELADRARAAGASYFVTADLLPGASPRVDVEMYATAGARRVLSLTGTDQEDPSRALDRLALELVRTLVRLERITPPVPEYALSATNSAAALREFVRGRSEFAAGSVDDAVDAFRRAVAADSAFGLAYLYWSFAETWAPRWNYPGAFAAAEAGLAHAPAMSPRWARLLRAQRHFARLESDSARADFQRIVGDEPELAEAWLGLGNVLFYFGGFLGERPTDALAPYETALRTDTAFAPVFDRLTQLSVALGDEPRARRYLARITDPALRAPLDAAVRLRFGGARARAAALADVAGLDRHSISALVELFGYDAGDLPLLDTLGSLLDRPGRPAEDRERGGVYRMISLAARGRWPAALDAWRSTAAPTVYNRWIIHAGLAGFPAGALTLPMYQHATRVVGAGALDYGRAGFVVKEPRDAFRALVHRALLTGDAATLQRLQATLQASRATAAPSDPEPDGLAHSLEARRRLLAGDTSAAIDQLRLALARAPWTISSFAPLGDAAPERLLLAQLCAARGEWPEARRWVDSFRYSWVVGDRLFLPAALQLRERYPQLR